MCGAITIRKYRKRSELVSLSISMKKTNGKIDVAICLKEVTGLLTPILQQISYFVSYAKCSCLFFFRLDFSITLWRYSLELHRFSQYRVTELCHICIHGCLTYTAGCELCKRWNIPHFYYSNLVFFVIQDNNDSFFFGGSKNVTTFLKWKRAATT